MILLTDAAQDQIIKLSREAHKLGIRLKVFSGGCSGYIYKFSVVEDAAEDEDKDVIISAAGAALFIDHDTAEKINGSTIDYVKDIMSERFVVTNPDSACCGCGKSFS